MTYGAVTQLILPIDALSACVLCMEVCFQAGWAEPYATLPCHLTLIFPDLLGETITGMLHRQEASLGPQLLSLSKKV